MPQNPMRTGAIRGESMRIRIPAALWGAWIVITLPFAVLNLILYITDIVEVY